MQKIYKSYRLFVFICFCLISFSDLHAKHSSVLPPVHVQGHQEANRFALQTDLVNVITWNPPKRGIGPVKYKIYRNSNLSDLAGTIHADKNLKFKDHNRKKNHTYTYFLVSVDAAGKKSSPIEIIFKGSNVTVKKNKNKLVAIDITPIDPTVARDFTVQFTATGIFSNGQRQNLTDKVTWKSSKKRIATVSNDPSSKGLATAINPGKTKISASLKNVTGFTTLTVSNATLVSIGVTPVDPTLAKNFKQPFIATGVFSDGTIENLTTEVSWSSSNEAIATISNTPDSQGVATGLSPGTTAITATFGTITGSTTLTVTNVTLVTIEVTPVNPTIPGGFTQQFTATGVFSDLTTEDLTTQVTWKSSDTGVAQISNSEGTQGLALSLRSGETEIAASLNGVTGSTTLTVTSASLVLISVTPFDPTIPAGFPEQFTATGVFSDQTTIDLTTQVTWESSHSNVAEISNSQGSQGLASALSRGVTKITATLKGVSGSTTLTVTNATLESIDVTPVESTIAPGFTEQFIATGVFSDKTTSDLTKEVTWESSDLALAAISNAEGSQGLATALSPGTATITAALEGVSGSAALIVTNAALVSISVTPVNPDVAAGLTEQFIATGVFDDQTTEDLTTQVTWKSSNLAVASISNAKGSEGLANALIPGTAEITAALDGVSGSTTLTVTNATLISIGVTPVEPTIGAGAFEEFIATGIFSDRTTADLTQEVTWKSSNLGVASISNAEGSQGLALGLTGGETTITAALKGVTGSTLLTVTNATLVSIGVTPAESTIAAGLTEQFIATGIYSDRTTSVLTTQVTWESSDIAIASISNAERLEGVATGLRVGTATITATLDNVSGTATLNVTNATLKSIGVTPIAPSISAGSTVQFTATGVFSDGSKDDLTKEVTWGSSDLGMAQISNAAGSEGFATGLKVGSPTITAALDGVVGSTSLEVTNALLVSINLQPVNPSVPAKSTIQFNATGIYSDNTTKKLTEIVTWLSSDNTIAQISNAQGSEGLATALMPVPTSGDDPFIFISATLDSVTGSTELTVTAVKLVSIDVKPANSSVPIKSTRQFEAFGTYSDGSTQPLTTQVTWESSKIAIASISNAEGSEGLATGLSGGTTQISATLNGVSGSTNLTTQVTLDSIVVTPVNPSVAAGFSQQFIATAFYSDLSHDIVTEKVTWESQFPSIAQISNDGNTSGKAQAFSPGSSKISATLNGKTGTTILTVTNALLVSIAVTPSNSTIAAGSPTQFTATGTFSDASTEDLTSQATWESSNTVEAEVSNQEDSKGRVTGKQVGSPTITATVDGIPPGSTTVTVFCPVITITSPFSLPNAFTDQAYAFQLQTSGGVQPITFTLVSGNLPGGITLIPSGYISSDFPPGFPQRPAGFYNFRVEAKSACGSTFQKDFEIFLVR